MFPSLSFYPSSLSYPLPPSPLYMPLCSPHRLLQCNLDPDTDLDLYLDLAIDAPKAAVPLDHFLPLLQGDLNLDTDLVLT